MNFKDFFNSDNPVMSFLGKVFDLMWLNILTLICCLPIITVGASLTAMYYALLKVLGDSSSSVTKEFFHAFKQNLRQATLIWLIYAVVLLVAVVDISLMRNDMSTLPPIVFGVLLVLTVIVLVEMNYTFGMLSHYDNTVGTTIKNALLLSLAHFPKSVLMAAILVVCGFLYDSYLFYLAPFIVMFGLSAPGFVFIWLFRKIFARLDTMEVDK